MNDEVNDFFGEVISSYTSEQGEQDGVLVKTDNPIINYITATVYHECIEPFIETSALTNRVLANKPILPETEIGKIKFVFNFKISEEEKKIAERGLLKKLLDTAIAQIKALKREDWMYELPDCRGWKLWVCQNETGKYTLMFPEDY